MSNLWFTTSKNEVFPVLDRWIYYILFFICSYVIMFRLGQMNILHPLFHLFLCYYVSTWTDEYITSSFLVVLMLCFDLDRWIYYILFFGCSYVIMFRLGQMNILHPLFHLFLCYYGFLMSWTDEYITSSFSVVLMLLCFDLDRWIYYILFFGCSYVIMFRLGQMNILHPLFRLFLCYYVLTWTDEYITSSFSVVLMLLCFWTDEYITSSFSFVLMLLCFLDRWIYYILFFICSYVIMFRLGQMNILHPLFRLFLCYYVLSWTDEYITSSFSFVLMLLCFDLDRWIYYILFFICSYVIMFRLGQMNILHLLFWLFLCYVSTWTDEYITSSFSFVLLLLWFDLDRWIYYILFFICSYVIMFWLGQMNILHPLFLMLCFDLDYITSSFSFVLLLFLCYYVSTWTDEYITSSFSFVLMLLCFDLDRWIYYILFFICSYVIMFWLGQMNILHPLFWLFLCYYVSTWTDEYITSSFSFVLMLLCFDLDRWIYYILFFICSYVIMFRLGQMNILHLLFWLFLCYVSTWTDEYITSSFSFVLMLLCFVLDRWIYYILFFICSYVVSTWMNILHIMFWLGQMNILHPLFHLVVLMLLFFVLDRWIYYILFFICSYAIMFRLGQMNILHPLFWLFLCYYVSTWTDEYITSSFSVVLMLLCFVLDRWIYYILFFICSYVIMFWLGQMNILHPLFHLFFMLLWFVLDRWIYYILFFICSYVIMFRLGQMDILHPLFRLFLCYYVLTWTDEYITSSFSFVLMLLCFDLDRWIYYILFFMLFLCYYVSTWTDEYITSSFLVVLMFMFRLGQMNILHPLFHLFFCYYDLSWTDEYITSSFSFVLMLLCFDLDRWIYYILFFICSYVIMFCLGQMNILHPLFHLFLCYYVSTWTDEYITSSFSFVLMLLCFDLDRWIYYIFFFGCSYVMFRLGQMNILHPLFRLFLCYYVSTWTDEYITSSFSFVLMLLCFDLDRWIYYILFFGCSYVIMFCLGQMNILHPLFRLFLCYYVSTWTDEYITSSFSFVLMLLCYYDLSWTDEYITSSFSWLFLCSYVSTWTDEYITSSFSFVLMLLCFDLDRWIYYIFFFGCSYVMFRLGQMNILHLLFWLFLCYVLSWTDEYITSSFSFVLMLLCFDLDRWIYYILFFICSYVIMFRLGQMNILHLLFWLFLCLCFDLDRWIYYILFFGCSYVIMLDRCILHPLFRLFLCYYVSTWTDEYITSSFSFVLMLLCFDLDRWIYYILFFGCSYAIMFRLGQMNILHPLFHLFLCYYVLTWTDEYITSSFSFVLMLLCFDLDRWIYYIFFFGCSYVMFRLGQMNILHPLFRLFLCYYVLTWTDEYITSSFSFVLMLLCFDLDRWIYYILFFGCSYVIMFRLGQMNILHPLFHLFLCYYVSTWTDEYITSSFSFVLMLCYVSTWTDEYITSSFSVVLMLLCFDLDRWIYYILFFICSYVIMFCLGQMNILHPLFRLFLCYYVSTWTDEYITSSFSWLFLCYYVSTWTDEYITSSFSVVFMFVLMLLCSYLSWTDEYITSSFSVVLMLLCFDLDRWIYYILFFILLFLCYYVSTWTDEYITSSFSFVLMLLCFVLDRWIYYILFFGCSYVLCFDLDRWIYYILFFGFLMLLCFDLDRWIYYILFFGCSYVIMFCLGQMNILHLLFRLFLCSYVLTWTDEYITSSFSVVLMFLWIYSIIVLPVYMKLLWGFVLFWFLKSCYFCLFFVYQSYLIIMRNIHLDINMRIWWHIWSIGLWRTSIYIYSQITA